MNTNKDSGEAELCRSIFPDTHSVTSSPGNEVLVNPSPSHEGVLTPWRGAAVKRVPLKRVGDSQAATIKAERVKAFERRRQGHAMSRGQAGTAPRCRGVVAGSHTTPATANKLQVRHFSPGEAETLEPKTRHRVLQEMAKVKGLQARPWQKGMTRGDNSGTEGGGVLILPDKRARDELFKRMDYNGNGALSLAEIDKAVVELWPQFNNKPALMRAYKAADKSGDGWIGRRGFKLLLQYIEYFNFLWHEFEAIDANHDRRLSLQEFVAGCTAVGHKLSLIEASREFNKMDENGGECDVPLTRTFCRCYILTTVAVPAWFYCAVRWLRALRRVLRVVRGASCCLCRCRRRTQLGGGGSGPVCWLRPERAGGSLLRLSGAGPAFACEWGGCAHAAQRAVCTLQSCSWRG